MGGPRDLGPLVPAGPGCPAGEVPELALAVSQPRGTESCSRTREHARAHAPGQRVGDGLTESPENELSLSDAPCPSGSQQRDRACAVRFL